MKLKLMWQIGLLSAIPLFAVAQPDEGLAECAEIDDTLRRLACYDELASSVGFEPPAVIAIPEAYANRPDEETPELTSDLPETGEWTETVETNADGEPSAVTLSSWAVTGASTEGYAISMTISCRRGRTLLSVHWVDYLGSWAEIETRIGGEGAGRRQWNLSSDGRAAFYPGRTRSFVDDAIDAGAVSFRVTPYAKTPITAEFDTSGLGVAFDPWRQMCRR